jgi:hypothetical protein
MDEITQAVKALPDNKSPGSDGLAIKFYKMYWTRMK